MDRRMACAGRQEIPGWSHFLPGTKRKYLVERE